MNDELQLTEEDLESMADKLIEEAAGADIAGCGAVIEKSFQPGRRRIEELGVRICSLARISSMTPQEIAFEE